MRKRARVLTLVLTLFAVGPFAAPEAAAQAGGFGGVLLSGESGEPVEGGVVEVLGPVTRSTVSGRDGRWAVENVPGGLYEVRVRHVAFAEARRQLTVPAQGEVEVRLSSRALPLDEVVVTAGRRMQRLAEVVVTTELITRADIEQAGAADLSQILLERVGVQLEGGVAAGEGIMLQGLSSERVLVLVDGQPLVGRISGMLDVSRIPTSAVERIEVVKGPQSSLYGSEAMGGVVNIITRRAGAERWRVGADLTAGTQGRVDGSGSLSGRVGGVGFLTDVGRRSTELTPGRAETRGALAERWDGLVRLGANPAAGLTVDASALLVDERQRWQTGPLYTFSDNRQWSAQVGAVWTRGRHRLAPTVNASEFLHLSRSALRPQPVEGTGDRELQRLIEAELLYGSEWGALELDGGLEVKREQIESDRVQGGEEVLHTIEPFAEATVPVGPLQVVPGARVTVSEQWGTHFTPRLATLFRPVTSVAVRASVGRGYRAPSFKELGMEFLNAGGGSGYRVRGNPDLQPETSTNVSLGVEWSSGLAYVRGQGFANRFDDFIETRLVGDSSGITVYTYDNISNGTTRGVELEGGLTGWGGRLEVGYSYLEARNSEDDARLLNRPAHSGRVTAERRLPLGVLGSVTATYTGTTPIQRTESGTIDRPGYLRLDVRATRAIREGLELSVGSRNVLDEQPERWPGYAGRHIYAGLSWGLSSPAR